MTPAELRGHIVRLTKATTELTTALAEFTNSVHGLANSVNDLTVMIGENIEDDEELPTIDFVRHDVESG